MHVPHILPKILTAHNGKTTANLRVKASQASSAHEEGRSDLLRKYHDNQCAIHDWPRVPSIRDKPCSAKAAVEKYFKFFGFSMGSINCIQHVRRPKARLNSSRNLRNSKPKQIYDQDRCPEPFWPLRTIAL